tara:strand:- start:2761 stop:3120 length:360 start_codon:yes stop_codon:yes gene_type:complete
MNPMMIMNPIREDSKEDWKEFPYRNVVVLLICWADELTGCWGKLKKLGKVFLENYIFEVENYQIPALGAESANGVPLMLTLAKLDQIAGGLHDDSLLNVSYMGHSGLGGYGDFAISLYR